MAEFKQAPIVNTVGELMAALAHFDPELPIAGTWEGLLEPIRVYAGATVMPGENLEEHGRKYIVLIDVDNGFYQAKHQEHLG